MHAKDMFFNSRRDICRGSWDASVPPWEHFGVTLGALGTHFGRFGDALAPAWDYLEALLGHLEAFWDMCRAPWEPPGEKN